MDELAIADKDRRLRAWKGTLHQPHVLERWAKAEYTAPAGFGLRKADKTWALRFDEAHQHFLDFWDRVFRRFAEHDGLQTLPPNWNDFLAKYERFISPATWDYSPLTADRVEDRCDANRTLLEGLMVGAVGMEGPLPGRECASS